MTLAAALNLALDPSTQAEGLRAICDFTLDALPETAAGVSTERLNVACVAALLLFGFGAAPNVAPRLPVMIGKLIEYEGLSGDDLTAVVRPGWDSPHAPRSAEWTAAARSLAAWADGKVSA